MSVNLDCLDICVTAWDTFHVASKLIPSKGSRLLRRWRGARSQADICKLLELDPATYCKFESGARRPGGVWATKIEQASRGLVPAVSWYQAVARSQGHAA